MTATELRPERWTPPKAPPLEGRWAPTGDLSELELLPVPGEGPEDVAVSADGEVFTGLQDGRLLRLTEGGERVDVIADGFGPILGVELTPEGRLLVCAADRGLFRVDPATGHREPLVTEVAGRPLVLTNNATVLADGGVLFTESSRRFRLENYRHDLIEQSATGGLYHLDPRTGAVTPLASGLSFANGVTVSRDERFAVVAETGRYRLQRVWLAGERAGQAEEFVTNLPGSPDNLSTAPDGTIWCAMPSLRVGSLDALLPRHPILRRVAVRIPEKLQPQPSRTAFVLAFDEEGHVVHNLRTDDSPYHFVTGVRAHGDHLYLSSLTAMALSRTPLPA